MSYACPVRVAGTVIYSVGLVGIEQGFARFPVSSMVAALREAAEQLSDLLSGSPVDAPES